MELLRLVLGLDTTNIVVGEAVLLCLCFHAQVCPPAISGTIPARQQHITSCYRFNHWTVNRSIDSRIVAKLAGSALAFLTQEPGHSPRRGLSSTPALGRRLDHNSWPV